MLRMDNEGTDFTTQLGGRPQPNGASQPAGRVRLDGELDRTLLRPQALGAVPSVDPLPPEPQPAVTQAPIPHVPASTRNRHRRARSDEPRHGCLAALLWPFALVIAIFCAVRMLPLEEASGRLIPEAVSIIPWLIIPAAVILLPALLWRRYVLSIISGLSLALLLWWHAGYFIPSGSLSQEARSAGESWTETSTEDGAMRIMTLNVFNGNADADAVVACVRDNNIELLALQEVTWSFLDELAAAGIYDYLPYAAYSDPGEWDNGGLNCLFSLAPLYDVNTDLLPTELSAMCAGTVDVGGRSLRFVSCHPGSPHLGGEWLWNQGLATIGELSEYDHSYVIMGDFNSTWNHARFRELLGTSFVDAGQQAGEGFHFTWPSNPGSIAGYELPEQVSGHVPALIEIDHIVYADNAGIFAGDIKTVEIEGTDHLALIATLEVQ